MQKKSKRRVRKNKRKTRKNKRKTRTYKKGGTNYDKVNCCICGKEVDKSDTLVPQSCSRINFEKAHRICSQCWWNTEYGFARENAPHGCPGCANNFPLTNVKPKTNVQPKTNISEIIDLTLEDD